MKMKEFWIALTVALILGAGMSAAEGRVYEAAAYLAMALYALNKSGRGR